MTLAKSSPRGSIRIKTVALILAIIMITVIMTFLFISEEKPVNTPVILISIDTLRPDHLGVYGYHRNTSPYIDEMAKNSIIFENAYAQSPNTIISHATMLTSLYPLVHGVTPSYRLEPEIETIAEYFKKQGYITGGFTTHGAWLNRKMGFDQGFDDFYSRFVSGDNINQRVFAFLEKNASKNFFLFVHYYDPHSDYRQLPYDTRTHFDRTFCRDYQGSFTGCRGNLCASKLLGSIDESEGESTFSAEDLQYIIDLYDGGILYTDYQVGRLFEELKREGIYENAIILITADHGEEFLEHGKFLHDQLYKEVMRVPLIIKFPGSQSRVRKTTPVGVIDIMPTLLDIAAIPYDNIQGRSLWPLIENNESQDRVVFSTLKMENLNQSDHISLRNQSFSLFTWDKFSRFNLFNIVADPAETVNIQDQKKEILEKLLRVTRKHYHSQLKLRNRLKYNQTKVEPSQEEIEKLKSLGYLN